MSLLEHIAAEAVTVYDAEFAEYGTYTPAGGSARTVRGIVDRVSELVDIGEIIERDGVAATMDVATSELPEVAIGDSMSVRGTLYRVVGVEPNGTGRTTLVLGI